jgi:predicted O-methyltransferase YrrM
MRPGTQTIDGLIFLSSLAVSLDAQTIFEIGTFTGVTTWTQARNLPEAVIHTLDIPPAEEPKWDVAEDDAHRASEDDLLYRALPTGKIVQHWSDSATFDFSGFEQAVNLVYVDGAHSEPYVRSDTEQALRMLSTGGAVVWDDYWRLSPGVVKVLHEQHSRCPLMRVPGTRLVAHLSTHAEDRI